MRNLILLLFLLLSVPLHASTQRALLIGVGDYPEAGAWEKISAENDLVHLQKALVFRGFNPQNIVLLKDEFATKKGIINAFDNLYKSIKSGDIIYIHFSGHGQQVCDDNGDEIDGLDEAIVPYDSFKDFIPNINEGEKLIRDDELNVIIRKIRSKAGKKGQVVFVLDSCHSGTGTREEDGIIYRGTKTIMAPEDFIKKRKESSSADFDLNSTEFKKKSAPLIVFSASSASELNQEIFDDNLNTVGSISYFLSKIMMTDKKFISFYEIYQRIQQQAKLRALRQEPQWEGGTERILFSSFMFDVDGYQIQNILTPSKLRVNGGILSGFHQGAEIEVKSIDKHKTISRGVVVKSFLTESIVEITKPLKLDYNELAQVYLKGDLINPQKGALLKAYHNRGKEDNIAVEVKTINCDNEQVIRSSKKTSEQINVQKDDCLDFAIINQSSNALYFSLLYITATNDIEILLPDIEGGYTPADCFLTPGSVHEPDFTISITGTPNKEYLKLLYSEQKIDISAILQMNKYRNRGDIEETEKLKTVTREIVVE